MSVGSVSDSRHFCDKQQTIDKRFLGLKAFKSCFVKLVSLHRKVIAKVAELSTSGHSLVSQIDLCRYKRSDHSIVLSDSNLIFLTSLSFCQAFLISH